MHSSLFLFLPGRSLFTTSLIIRSWQRSVPDEYEQGDPHGREDRGRSDAEHDLVGVVCPLQGDGSCQRSEDSGVDQEADPAELPLEPAVEPQDGVVQFLVVASGMKLVQREECSADGEDYPSKPRTEPTHVEPVFGDGEYATDDCSFTDDHGYEYDVEDHHAEVDGRALGVHLDSLEFNVVDGACGKTESM